MHLLRAGHKSNSKRYKNYKLLCMNIRLQAGFEPSTLSVQKKCSCTLPTAPPLRCHCRWQKVRFIMLTLYTAKLILDVPDFSKTNKLFTNKRIGLSIVGGL